jgi:hypothetical protein
LGPAQVRFMNRLSPKINQTGEIIGNMQEFMTVLSENWLNWHRQLGACKTHSEHHLISWGIRMICYQSYRGLRYNSQLRLILTSQPLVSFHVDFMLVLSFATDVQLHNTYCSMSANLFAISRETFATTKERHHAMIRCTKSNRARAKKRSYSSIMHSMDALTLNLVCSVVWTSSFDEFVF